MKAILILCFVITICAIACNDEGFEGQVPIDTASLLIDTSGNLVDTTSN